MQRIKDSCISVWTHCTLALKIYCCILWDT